MFIALLNILANFGLLETSLEEHVSNNNHVYFIPCVTCDIVNPTCAKFFPVRQKH